MLTYMFFVQKHISVCDYSKAIIFKYYKFRYLLEIMFFYSSKLRLKKFLRFDNSYIIKASDKAVKTFGFRLKYIKICQNDNPLISWHMKRDINS